MARRGDRRSVGGLASVSMGPAHVVYFAVLMFSQIGPNTHAAWANGKRLKFGEVAEDTTLGTFAISKGALQPAFTSKLVNYSCSESYETQNITIYAKTSNSSCRVRIASETRTSNLTHVVHLKAGTNMSVRTVVTCSEPKNATVYTVNISIPPVPPPPPPLPLDPRKDASLKQLSVSTGELNPPFEPGVILYSIEEVCS